MKKLDKNTRIGLMLVGFVCLMIGVAYASVPLYEMFCKVTGFGGTTQQAAVAPKEIKDRTVKILFDGNVDSGLPWDFGPDVRSVEVKIGEQKTISYHARNRSEQTLVGTATYNVTPEKAGAYFYKIQCFCFERQVLKPGETAELPVQFYIDPAIVDDKNGRDVKEITLSYTFFLAKDQKRGQDSGFRIQGGKQSSAGQ